LASMEIWTPFGEAAKTALGFFWKSGWAFVLGYFISAMIQAFVPRGRLTPYLGGADAKSVGLATAFGAISSSCSFAALAAARALVMKEAHFVAAVAFMFASTNLVVELGILILIFLGWQFLAAEIVGGLVLIALSRLLLIWTYPSAWLEKARDRVEQDAGAEEEDFDWRQRIRSAEGWRLVGRKFVVEWAMVWEEIAIGFTVAGFVAVLVPDAFWKMIFLAEKAAVNPLYFPVVLENALLAPFVAAATFIGSMENIPLATVLNSSGVLFAGVMGFIYSDLMVPPPGGDQRPVLRLANGALHCRGHVCQHRLHRSDPALRLRPPGRDPGERAGREGRRSIQAGLHVLDEPGGRGSGGVAVLVEPPLGGEILSHDFVEAALMRRAGYKVLVACDLAGSYEECPSTLIDFAKRDQRWSQGNLQHLRLLFVQGFHPVSRLHFWTGAMSYLSSPLWLLFMVLGVAWVHTADLRIGSVEIAQASSLFLFTLVLLFGPKLYGYLLLLANRDRLRAHGGGVPGFRRRFAGEPDFRPDGPHPDDLQCQLRSFHPFRSHRPVECPAQGRTRHPAAGSNPCPRRPDDRGCLGDVCSRLAGAPPDLVDPSDRDRPDLLDSAVHPFEQQGCRQVVPFPRPAPRTGRNPDPGRAATKAVLPGEDRFGHRRRACRPFCPGGSRPHRERASYLPLGVRRGRGSSAGEDRGTGKTR